MRKMCNRVEVGMKRGVVVAIILFMGGLWAAADLGSKSWAKHHLANASHLLFVEGDGKTICQAFKDRLGIKDCSELDNRVYPVTGPLKVKASTPLTTLMVDYPLLFVIQEGSSYAVRLKTHHEVSQKRITTIGKSIKESLKLSDQEFDMVLKNGVFGLSRTNGAISPSKTMEKGKKYLLSYRVITLIPGMLDLSYVENPAGAWGILHGLRPEIRKWVFYVLTLVALAVILFLIIFPPSYSWWVMFALGGILGGAIGNLVDRFTNGAVVDFIHMFWHGLNWPNYNVADIGITIGLIILLIHSFFSGSKQEP